jgi:hypothetical protein
MLDFFSLLDLRDLISMSSLFVCLFFCFFFDCYFSLVGFIPPMGKTHR